MFLVHLKFFIYKEFRFYLQTTTKSGAELQRKMGGGSKQRKKHDHKRTLKKQSYKYISKRKPKSEN